MFPICRSSTRITSNRRAMSVDTFSAQSLRRSVSRARSRAIACLHPAAAVRSPPSAGEPALQPPQPDPLPRGQGGAVQQLAGGQGRGDRHAPVDAHRLAVTRCRDRIGDHREGDMPAARAVHRDPVGLRARRHRAGPAEPHPPGLGHPDLADLTGHAAHVPLPPARPTIRNPSSRPALRHDGRPAGFPGSKNAVIAWAKSRRACCCTVWEPAASHGYSARAAVSCRHCSR